MPSPHTAQAKASDILGAFLGDSEGNLRAVFARARDIARTGKCVLHIDAIDQLCPRRAARADGGTQGARLSAQLLVLMDGLQARGEVLRPRYRRHHNPRSWW